MQTFDDLCGTQTHKRTESVKQQEAQLMLTTGSTPFLRYSSSKNFMTLKWGSKVTQGH